MLEVRNGFVAFEQSRFFLRFRVRSKRQEVVISTFACYFSFAYYLRLRAPCGAHTLTATSVGQVQKNPLRGFFHVSTVRKSYKSCQERESFRSTLFQKGRRGTGTESPKHSVRSARGELKNSPVDCFLRGEALQERASPLRRSSNFFLRTQACAKSLLKICTFYLL